MDLNLISAANYFGLKPYVSAYGTPSHTQARFLIKKPEQAKATLCSLLCNVRDGIDTDLEAGAELLGRDWDFAETHGTSPIEPLTEALFIAVRTKYDVDSKYFVYGQSVEHPIGKVILLKKEVKSPEDIDKLYDAVIAFLTITNSADFKAAQAKLRAETDREVEALLNR